MCEKRFFYGSQCRTHIFIVESNPLRNLAGMSPLSVFFPLKLREKPSGFLRPTVFAGETRLAQSNQVNLHMPFSLQFISAMSNHYCSFLACDCRCLLWLKNLVVTSHIPHAGEAWLRWLIWYEERTFM